MLDAARLRALAAEFLAEADRQDGAATGAVPALRLEGRAIGAARAAEILGVSTDTVKRWAAKDPRLGFKPEGEGLWRFSLGAVQERAARRARMRDLRGMRDVDA